MRNREKLPENPYHALLENHEPRAAQSPLDSLPLIGEINFDYVLACKALTPDCCIYCGDQLTDQTHTIDHIIPRWKFREVYNQCFLTAFGTLNTVPACWPCNQLKGSRSLREFYQFIRRRWIRRRIVILSNLKKLMK